MTDSKLAWPPFTGDTGVIMEVKDADGEWTHVLLGEPGTTTTFHPGEDQPSFVLTAISPAQLGALMGVTAEQAYFVVLVKLLGLRSGTLIPPGTFMPLGDDQ